MELIRISALVDFLCVFCSLTARTEFGRSIQDFCQSSTRSSGRPICTPFLRLLRCHDLYMRACAVFGSFGVLVQVNNHRCMIWSKDAFGVQEGSRKLTVKLCDRCAHGISELVALWRETFSKRRLTAPSNFGSLAHFTHDSSMPETNEASRVSSRPGIWLLTVPFLRSTEQCTHWISSEL